MGLKRFLPILLLLIIVFHAGEVAMSQDGDSRLIPLPKIADLDNRPLNQCLFERRSIRRFAEEPLSLEEIAQLLWASQGSTTGSHRTVPSAGALYPVEVYLLVARGGDLERGLYHYQVAQHAVRQISTKNLMPQLTRATGGQNWMAPSAAVVIMAVEKQRTTSRYGERGERYVLMEVGNVTQNVHLQAAALKLGTTIIGSFRDDDVNELLDLPKGQEVIAFMPVGKPR